ncbi:hypothetical protein SKAU_G00426010 [Synaphobranchus kaupii]|uniref:Uncharacterized protein n=1 Tax=Synaphobranchus kaupii TaxID=118154 RepID=A0A9Q1I8I7_SYNKA|nr:hypothetical protein SKAU_G00426010 [Synaphobranchus kaupii]
MVFITTTLKSVMKYLKKKRAVSNLDKDSRWTVHYAAPWLQQDNVHLPESPAHCCGGRAFPGKVNLKCVCPEYDKLRKDWFHSSWYYPQDSALSSSTLSHSSTQHHAQDKKSTESIPEENLEFSPRAQTPLQGDNDDDVLPLPTPEERMRQQALTVPRPHHPHQHHRGDVRPAG